ncbi:hypothetical protein LT988_13080 [Thiocapsa bogorovii]|nr:hypothetical protein LT988_13080 [Thiocapsa bogorovii]
MPLRLTPEVHRRASARAEAQPSIDCRPNLACGDRQRTTTSPSRRELAARRQEQLQRVHRMAKLPTDQLRSA